MTDMQIKEVSPDNAELYAIEAQVVATTPNVLETGTPEDFLMFLNQGGVPSAYIEYDQSGKQVGYLALSALNGSDAMEVRSIAVKPEYQHGGFGKTMMAEAERIAHQAGRKKMTLVTSPENTGAVQFYQGLGYTIAGRVENYYGDGTPRYVLEKQIK